MDLDEAAVKTQWAVAVGGDSAAASLPAAPPPEPAASAEASAPRSQRILRATSSRERSPRRPSAPPTASSPSVWAKTSPALPAGAGGFSVGQAAVLDGLVARPELTGHHVMLRSFDESASRWAVSLDAAEETIRVKAINLKPLVFGPENG